MFVCKADAFRPFLTEVLLQFFATVCFAHDLLLRLVLQTCRPILRHSLLIFRYLGLEFLAPLSLDFALLLFLDLHCSLQSLLFQRRMLLRLATLLPINGDLLA